MARYVGFRASPGKPSPRRRVDGRSAAARGLACKSRRRAAEDRHRRRSLLTNKTERWLRANRPLGTSQRYPPPDESGRNGCVHPVVRSNTSARTTTRKSACRSTPTNPSRWRAPTSRPRASTLSALPALSWSARSAKSSSSLAAALWLLAERRANRPAPPLEPRAQRFASPQVVIEEAV